MRTHVTAGSRGVGALTVCGLLAAAMAASGEITSTTPGEGNSLKRGVKPVRNRVPDSEGPPDFWAGAYTVKKIGPYPLPPFPTSNEVN